MAAFLARAVSFLAQAVSFHLLSTSASNHHPVSSPTSLVSLSNGLGLISALDGNNEVSEVQVVKLVVKEQAHDSQASAVFSRRWRVRRRAPTESRPAARNYSLSIDDVHNGAELAEISSVADVSDTSNFNKTSENLGSV